MEYFYEKNLSALNGWLVLLDFEGTLAVPGTEELSLETKEALKQLTSRNHVVICSNREPIPGFETKFDVTWPSLSHPKPHPKSVLELVGDQHERMVVIGDTIKTDGDLARALDVPFVPVATLGRSREGAKGFFYDRVPAVLLPESYESVALVVNGHKPFFEHLAFDIKNRKLLRSVEHLAHELTLAKVQVCIDPVRLSGFQSVVIFGDDVDALKDAIQAKKKGFIKNLVVAPMSSTLTADQRAHLQEESIDAVLLPSEVVKSNLSELDQYFTRSQVWNLGIAKTKHRRLPLSHAPECELVVLATEEKEFKELIDILWRFGISLSLIAHNAKFSWLKSWLQKRRKVSWRLIAGAGEYLPLAEDAWTANLPTLIIAPAEAGVSVPDQCGMRIDSVRQLESALPDLLESLANYEPAEYARIHCSTESRARELMSILRSLAAS